MGRYSRFVLALSLLFPAWTCGDDLSAGWSVPPREARLRAYWWWLNGCVTKEAITRDLEEMKAKGFGGALICDADGSSQDGNERAPHGPTFLTAPWRELYRHALREADRLGLEMSLNIQSGWNLGGPMVTADDAAKKLTWSETTVSGPGRLSEPLPLPAMRDDYYRDTCVVAYRLKDSSRRVWEAKVSAASAQAGHGVERLCDGDAGTFWVSAGARVGEGPSPTRPVSVQVEFAEPVELTFLRLQPRSGYGPRECELLVSEDGQTYRAVTTFALEQSQTKLIEFEQQRVRFVRILIRGAFDRGATERPRNVQIAELAVGGPGGVWPSSAAARQPIQNWKLKAGLEPLHFSAPDTQVLLEEQPGVAGEEDVLHSEVVDLTDRLRPQGVLDWDVPQGRWQVLRFGYTIGNRSYVSTCSEGWNGYAIDVLDRGALERYWEAVVQPLVADAGTLAGTALKYLHTDSWEVEPLNWTPTMCEEFQRRCGYDMVPWLPVLAGRIVDSRRASHRFLYDFRKILGDLAIDNHYRPFRDRAHQHKLEIHPESGGPHAVPIDAQRCLGFNDVPMSEFWAWSWRHRVGDDHRFFVKQPASAAHTYGRRIVAAEGFTTIGPHWQETLWDNLKPAFDKACCEGLNRLVWHEFVCSPAEFGLPGLQYFAGTHLNPNVTWWSRSEPFFAYINRCQFLLQRGLFVADVCYYYGDHVPNFAQHKRTDPAGALPGFDYDIMTAEALIERAAVQDGDIVLPDGMRYRLLVLRDHPAISLPVLEKVQQLVTAGARVLGTKPVRAVSLRDDEQKLLHLADSLWDTGQIMPFRAARDVLLESGVQPDFEAHCTDDTLDIDFIHRRDGDDDIYFVANRNPRGGQAECVFRCSGKLPELWDPVSGHRYAVREFQTWGNQTAMTLDFAPCGAWFVVFRSPTQSPPVPVWTRHDAWIAEMDLEGPWTVTFDPRWGGPGPVTFEQLVSWPDREEPGIKYYSGTATYRVRFARPSSAGPDESIALNLGDVRELAEVRLNGQPLAVLWTPPFRVEVGAALRDGENTLEIDVVNFWPNRIIGDDALGVSQRVTKTNIRKLTRATPLMPAGLMGPVRWERRQAR